MEILNPKREEFKIAMTAIRERIAAAKRKGTRNGRIDYQGCRYVTSEFINMLEEAFDEAEKYNCIYAYSVAMLIQINLAKLASTADDSYGDITDARFYVEYFNVLKELHTEKAHGKLNIRRF